MSNVINYYNLNEIVTINESLRKTLKFRNNTIKFSVLINYVLCNQFDHYYDKKNDRIVHFMLRCGFKKFLIRENKFKGETYSREGVMLLLYDFIKKKIHIII